MSKEYKFIAQNSKGAIELQDGIYLPLEEVEKLMQKYTKEQLTTHSVVGALKGEEKITFSKWLELNKYKYRYENLYSNGETTTLIHVDLLGKEYIKYFNL
jgi:hypothetical protein